MKQKNSTQPLSLPVAPNFQLEIFNPLLSLSLLCQFAREEKERREFIPETWRQKWWKFKVVKLEQVAKWTI